MKPYQIREFYHNPSGKGATALNIKATQDQYNARYDNVVKKVELTFYKIRTDIYAHVTIPSSVEGVRYDVVLVFHPNKASLGHSLSDMDMQIFSNSPSFLYTYAYSYLKQGLFAREFKRKLSSRVLTDLSKVRNPYGILSYDFSIYCALRYIILNEYLNITSLNMKEISFSTLLALVQNADALQKDRKIQHNLNRSIEKEEKQKKIKQIHKFGEDKEASKDKTSGLQEANKIKPIAKRKTIKSKISKINKM